MLIYDVSSVDAFYVMNAFNIFYFIYFHFQFVLLLQICSAFAAVAEFSVVNNFIFCLFTYSIYSVFKSCKCVLLLLISILYMFRQLFCNSDFSIWLFGLFDVLSAVIAKILHP